MTDNTRMKFAAAMGKAFRATGESLQDFGNQLKQLTPEDKEWYHAELNKSGIECDPPAA